LQLLFIFWEMDALLVSINGHAQRHGFGIRRKTQNKTQKMIGVGWPIWGGAALLALR
jgi:hypothetical protein